jgi:hypothetical protein
MIHRHNTDIGEENFTYDVAQSYRAMHRRMHRTGDWEHEHSPEPPSAAVECALRCLMDNRMWGWREIAGTKGEVAAHPDGSYAVRLGTTVRHFNQVDRIAQMLMKGKFPR